MRTRFTLFSWGVRCALCCRQVCAKCSGRMRIPLEHFSSVPVYALSPASTSPLSTPTAECGSAESGRRFSRANTLAAPTSRDRLSCVVPPVSAMACGGVGSRSGAGSAPTSPTAGRRRADEAAADERPPSGVGGGPTSLPVFTSQGPTTISAR